LKDDHDRETASPLWHPQERIASVSFGFGHTDML